MNNRFQRLVGTTSDLYDRFRRDESGNYLIITGLLMSAMVGLAGLGTDYGIWTWKQQTMQGAADSAAVAGAIAYANGYTTSVTSQATSVISSYLTGSDWSTLTQSVNRPPSQGNYTGNANYIEVILNQPRTPLFSTIYRSQPVNITARAVAYGPPQSSQGCVLSLDPSASGAVTVQGHTNVNLLGCSLYDNSNAASSLTMNGGALLTAGSVNTDGGISGCTAGATSCSGITTSPGTINPNTGSHQADPYAGIPNPTPSGSNLNFKSGSASFDGGGVFKGGLKLSAGDNVTLNNGTYYIEGGSLDVAGSATLTGTNVTLVFTNQGSNYATATINGGADVQLTAPTSGTYQGIVIFGDRNMPTGTTFKFNGGGQEQFGGAIYLPKGQVQWAGGANNANSCTQLIADTVTFTGTSYFAINNNNCPGGKVARVGAALVKLVE
jgi:Flp pilus assembly protein TadG